MSGVNGYALAAASSAVCVWDRVWLSVIPSRADNASPARTEGTSQSSLMGPNLARSFASLRMTRNESICVIDDREPRETRRYR